MTNPYIGPRSFQTGEKLYGRDRELKDLLGLLIAERIVLLNSPSGAGKTSLINAGLIPALRERDFAILPTMRVSLDPPPEYGRTGNRYIRSLLLSLEEGLPAEQQASPAELAAFSFDAYLKRYAALTEHGSDAVLIFDQFEEILTIDPTDTEAKQEFFAQVGEALRNQRKRWALFSMREDYVASLQPYLRPVPTRLNTTFYLGLLDYNAARGPIQQPARSQGVEFTDDAARQLIDDLRRVQVQLPNGEVELQLGPTVEPVQLQVVCRRLWDGVFATSTPSADQARSITVAELSAVGNVDHALSAYYAEQVQAVAHSLSSNGSALSQERNIREWFDRQLITVNGVRSQVIQGPETSGGLLNSSIWPLINAYLVRAEKRRGLNWFELSHDRMITPVRSDNSQWFVKHLSTLQRQADLWNRSGRPDGLLLADGDLVEAEVWVQANEASLLQHEREFLADCRHAREAAERAARLSRRIRNLAIGASILSVLATIAFVVALIFYNQAVRQTRSANARGLAANAIGALNTDPEQSVILAMAAVGATYNYGLPPGPDALDALQAAVQRSRVRQTLASDNKLYNAAYQPGSQQIALAGVAGNLRLWNPQEGRETPLKGHDTDVFAAVFSSDGSRMASTDAAGVIIIWDVANAAEAQRITLPDNLALSIDLSSDNRLLAAGSFYDSAAHVIDLATQTTVYTIPHTFYLTSVDISPDNRTLLTTTGDGIVTLWDLRTGQQRSTYPHGPVLVTAARFSPDGRQIATIDDTGALRLWAVNQPGEPLSTLRGTATSLTSLAYSADGAFVASGVSDGTIQVWDAVNRQLLLTLSGHDARVSGVAFQSDGLQLASTSDDGTARIWSLEQIYPTGATSVEFSSAGDLAVGTVDGSVRVIDPANGRVRALLRQHTLDVNDLSFDAKGQYLYVASIDGTASVWAMNNLSAPQLIYTNHQAGAPAGEIVDALRAIALNPNNDLVATAGQQGIIHLWRPTTGETLRTLSQEGTAQINALVFSPRTGTRLAAANVSGEVVIWDVAAGQALRTIASDGQIGSLLFSTDERQLLVGTQGGELRIYDLQNGDMLGQHPLHNGNIVGMQRSPNGAFFASASSDTTLKLFQSDPREALLTIREPGPLSGLAYSSDGRLIATVGLDGGLRLYPLAPDNPLDPEPLLALARQRVTRPITEDECRQYRLGAEHGCPASP